jgi:capsular exopolysaccharide synthesis family protein
MENNAESSIDIREYWHIVAKRHWTVITVLIIVVSIAAIGSFMTKPSYKASAVIQVEREIPKVLSFEEVYNIDASQQTFYRTQVKLIKSRSIARKAIEKLDWRQSPKSSNVSINKWSEKIKKILKFRTKDKKKPEIDRDSRIVNAFLRKLVVEPDRNSQIIYISFISQNPKLCADAANTVAECFVESRLEAKYITARQAYDFLNKQIKQLMNDVAFKEQEMQKYAQDKEILSLDDSENIIVMQLVELNTEYTRVKARRIEKEAIYRGLMNVSADSIPEVIKNPLIQELKAEYASLEREYAEKSKKFKAGWPEMIQLNSKLDKAKQRLDKEINDIVSKVRNSAKAEYLTALKQEQSIQDMLDQQKDKTANLHTDAIIYNNLKTEVDNKRALLQALTKRQNEAGVSADIKEMGSTYVQIVDRAEVPQSAYKPNKRLNIILGIMVGLMLGIGLAFFFEHLDISLKSIEDVERYLRLPIIGIIPALDGTNKSTAYSYAYEEYLGSQSQSLPRSVEKIVFINSKSSISEAYRSLRTSILLSSPNSPPKVILVTSSQPKEGKTATAINIAIALAQLGKKAVLIESDLRRPRVSRIFKIYNRVGVSNFLVGNTEVNQIIFRTEIANLFIIPSGPPPPNPAELIATLRMERLIEGCKKSFDFVILDSPPLLAVTDAQILANKADGVVFVTHAGVTSKHSAKLGREKLQNAKIIGVVLNQINLNEHGYYYQHYYNYYGKERDKKKLVIRMGNKK